MSAIKIHLFKPDPVNQFGIWFEEVLNNKKPNSNAVALSTSSAGGRISSRMVSACIVQVVFGKMPESTGSSSYRPLVRLPLIQ